MKSLNLKIIVFLIFLVTLSCKDEFGIEKEKSLVSVRDGFLEFRDKAAYDLVGQQLKGKSQAELDSWEGSLNGFVSMRSVYNKALTEEENFFTNGGLADHSAFVNQNIEKFIIEDTDLRPNLPYSEDINLPTFVNQFGIVKIGSSIFEYRGESIKEIRDGDISKIAILKDFTESNKEKDIAVTNITTRNISMADNRDLKIAFSGNSDCTGYTNGGGQRVKGSIAIHQSQMVDVFGSTPYPGQVVFYEQIVSHADNQIKTLGKWVGKNTAELEIIGVVEITPYGTLSFSANSNGQQTKSISVLLYSSGWVNTGFNELLSISGSLTFYGRHGSNCSM